MEFVIVTIVRIFVWCLTSFNQIVDAIYDWVTPLRSSVKQQPLSFESWINKKLPFELDKAHWFVYQLYDDIHSNHIESQYAHILAWAGGVRIVDGFALFPPEVFQTIEGKEKDTVLPDIKFPEEFGKATAFHRGSLMGYQFNNPHREELAGSVWFSRNTYHTGGRISMHRLNRTTITHWTPNDTSKNKFDVEAIPFLSADVTSKKTI